MADLSFNLNEVNDEFLINFLLGFGITTGNRSQSISHLKWLAQTRKGFSFSQDLKTFSYQIPEIDIEKGNKEYDSYSVRYTCGDFAVAARIRLIGSDWEWTVMGIVGKEESEEDAQKESEKLIKVFLYEYTKERDES